MFFDALSLDSTDASNIAFVGGNQATRGVYASLAGGPITRIVDTSMLFPGTTATFTDFASVAIDPTDIAFVGSSTDGDKGLFAAIDGNLVDLLNVGDSLDGKIVSDLSRAGLTHTPSALRVFFRASFDDGSTELLSIATPEPSGDLAATVAVITLSPDAMRSTEGVSAA